MIHAITLAVALAAQGALFDVHTFPAPVGGRFFIAPLDGEGGADLVVLHGHSLTVYPDGLPGGAREVEMPPETSAVDVFDLDGDEITEVIGVAGDRIIAWSFEDGATSPASIELFRLPTQLAACGPAPFLYVLAMEWKGRVVLGLPRERAFELRDVTGVLVDSFPLTIEGLYRASYGRPFTADAVSPPVVGSRDALEVEIRRTIEIEPALPRELAVTDKRSLLARRSLPPRAADASARNPAYWPWFSLVTRRGDHAPPQDLAQWDVLYSIADDDAGASLVCFRTPGRAPNDAPRIGPQRRFPGAIMNTLDRFPDFNGDGFVDLALWAREERLPAAGALARVAATGRASWRIAAYFFEPRRRCFSATPTTRIIIDAPFAWLVNATAGPPTPLALFEDFDADGRTDFGCATDVDEFSVWRCGASGFEESPAFRQRFAEPLQTIEFCKGFEPGAAAAVGLRGAHSLFLLRPQ